MKMSYKIVLILGVFLSLAACTNNQVHPVRPMPIVLKFEDFGPVDSAKELLGEYQYSWPDRENQIDVPRNIQVVVYAAGDLDQVREDYATNRESKIDYRYVEHGVARRWLEEKIAYQKIAIDEGGEVDLGSAYENLTELYETLVEIEMAF